MPDMLGSPYGGFESAAALLALSLNAKRLRKMGKLPARQEVKIEVPQPRKKEQGRNEKCACGSGKKYKNCCGA